MKLIVLLLKIHQNFILADDTAEHQKKKKEGSVHLFLWYNIFHIFLNYTTEETLYVNTLANNICESKQICLIST